MRSGVVSQSFQSQEPIYVTLFLFFFFFKQIYAKKTGFREFNSLAVKFDSKNILKMLEICGPNMATPIDTLPHFHLSWLILVLLNF